MDGSPPPSPEAEKRPSAAQPPPSPTFITDLRENDVLLGRGQPILNYPGNLKFRKYIVDHKEAYVNSAKHAAKDDIARKVLRQIEAAKGRFLSKIEDDAERTELGVPDSVLHAWKLVDETTRLKKVKQALRENLQKSGGGGVDKSAPNGDGSGSPPSRRKRARLKRDVEAEMATGGSSHVASLPRAQPEDAFPYPQANFASDRYGRAAPLPQWGVGYDKPAAAAPDTGTRATLQSLAALESSLLSSRLASPTSSGYRLDGSSRLWRQGSEATLSQHRFSDPKRQASGGLASRTQASAAIDWSALQVPLNLGRGSEAVNNHRGDELAMLLQRRSHPSMEAYLHRLGIAQHPDRPQASHRDLTLAILQELEDTERLSYASGNSLFPTRSDPYVPLRDMLPQQALDWPSDLLRQQQQQHQQQRQYSSSHYGRAAAASEFSNQVVQDRRAATSINDLLGTLPDHTGDGNVQARASFGDTSFDTNTDAPGWMEQMLLSRDQARLNQLLGLAAFTGSTDEPSSSGAPAEPYTSSTPQAPNTDADVDSKPRAKQN